MFAHFVCRVDFRVESIEFIGNQLRTKILIVLVKIIPKLNEFFQVTTCRDLFNFYCHSIKYMLFRRQRYTFSAEFPNKL